MVQVVELVLDELKIKAKVGQHLSTILHIANSTCIALFSLLQQISDMSDVPIELELQIVSSEPCQHLVRISLDLTESD